MSVANALLYGDVPSRLLVRGLRAEDIARAHEGLFRFEREVPAAEQPRWLFDVVRDPKYPEPDDGVIRRAGGAGDQKLFLHFRPGLSRLLAERGVSILPWQSEWLTACGRIWCVFDAAMSCLAREMDARRSGFRFCERLRNRPDDHCLRILKYERRAGTLAHPHGDRCAVTFRIAESHPGFFTQHGWERHIHPPPETPAVDCFTGEQLEEITGGAVRTTWHGAEDMTGGTCERWAIVFFGKMRPSR